MKTIVIIGGTYLAACQRLQQVCKGASSITQQEGYHEAKVDGHRVIAMGGNEEDVCWLQGLGFKNIEIITVQADRISDRMQKRINHVRSTQRRG